VTDEKDPEKKESEAVTAPDEAEAKAEEKSEASEKSEEKKSEEKKPEEKKPEEKKPKAAKKKSKEPDGYRLAPSNPVSGAWKSFAGMGAVGVVGAAAGYYQDHTRFAFAWLFGFVCALSLAIGALLFVMMHHLTNANWGVVVRRVAEVFGASSWVLLLLIVPVIVMKGTLFGEFLGKDEADKAAPQHHASLDSQQDPRDLELAANDFQPHGGFRGPGPGGPMRPHFQPHGPPGGSLPSPHPPGGVHGTPIHMHVGSDVESRAEHAEHEEVMKAKNWYLNPTFFWARLVFYFAVWYLIGYLLLKWSSEQDKSKDPMLTVKLARFSTAGVALMTLTLTFASFDWVMSLDPTWYSTIFGVTFFAGSMVCLFAMLILTFLGMRQSGVLVKEVTVEHYHDLGKLLFGFMCFWAYVCFAQFFLIWYAAIPEEVVFYHHRWDVGPWRTISLAIIFLHFIIPFIFIMSRNVKRNLGLLKVGAGLLMTMHVIDVYWLVMPNVPHQTTFAPNWIDVFGFMAPVGIFLAVAFRTLTKYPIIPIGDPRLQRSIHFLNA